MTSAKYEVEKFIGLNDFGLWQLKMRALLILQGLLEALEGESKLDRTMIEKDKTTLLDHNVIVSSLGDKVLRQVLNEQQGYGCSP